MSTIHLLSFHSPRVCFRNNALKRVYRVHTSSLYHIVHDDLTGLQFHQISDPPRAQVPATCEHEMFVVCSTKAALFLRNRKPGPRQLKSCFQKKKTSVSFTLMQQSSFLFLSLSLQVSVSIGSVRRVSRSATDRVRSILVTFQ